MNSALIPLVTGAEVTFWIAGPITILGALGLIFSRKAVYSALSMAATMLALAALYASMNAPFLAMIQIIVYTGAILMLFLFVLMMVGVDTTDSAVETIKGQRIWAIIGGIGLAALLVFAVGGSVVNHPAGDLTQANAQYGGNVQGVAALIFGRYVFVFELLSALLITAALGAMVLAHRVRVHPKKGQREHAADRMRAYATEGEHPGPLPNSGVFANSNAITVPALLPDGSVAEKSISHTLTMRGVMEDPTSIAAATASTFAALEASIHAEEEDE